MSHDLTVRVADHFRIIDEGTSAFRAATGLACPPGCGACCLSPDVETTIADLHPLAVALVREGRAEATLALLDARPDQRPCILYAADPIDPRIGRCTEYANRPSICRLYGFSGRRSARGSAELMTCRTMRAIDPAGVARASAAIAEGLPLPILADCAGEVAAEATGEQARALPINQALRNALERAVLAQRLSLLAEAEVGHEGDPDPVDGPTVPPRRAA